MFTKEELECIKGEIKLEEEFMYNDGPELLYGCSDPRDSREAWYHQVALYKSIIKKIDLNIDKVEE